MIHKLICAWMFWWTHLVNSFQTQVLPILLKIGGRLFPAPTQLLPEVGAGVDGTLVLQSLEKALKGCIPDPGAKLVVTSEAWAHKALYFLWSGDQDEIVRDPDFYLQPESFYRMTFSGDEGTDVFWLNLVSIPNRFQHIRWIWVSFYSLNTHVFYLLHPN